MEIVSNKMIFNDNGELVGFSKPVVHSYSKGSHALKMMKHITSKLKVIIIAFFMLIINIIIICI